MKENYTRLYPNEKVTVAVSDYAFAHSSKLPKHISDHHAWGSENHERANYMISPLQAQFQIWFAKALGAKRKEAALLCPSGSISLHSIHKLLPSNSRSVIEIGTFIGFSTMGWAEAVGRTGHVTGLEFSAEYAEIAKDTFAKNGIKNVELIVGDARESLKSLAAAITEPYDLIFIDADKTSYPMYLSLILELSPKNSISPRLLRPGGIILADNILRRGLVAEFSAANPFFELQHGEKNWKPDDMAALDSFNKALANNERLDTFLMPMFDGLGMGRLID